MSAGIAAVVVDTGVFSAPLSRKAGGLVDLYRDDLVGRKLLISFQTVAEVRYGALKAGWGSRRVEELESRISLALTVPPHDALTHEWAELRHVCRQAGHAFQDKIHSADLWVAATARLAGVPVVTHDTGYRELPGLDVICRA